MSTSPSRRSTRSSAGKSTQYLKDERAREDYLIDALLDGAVLRLATGEERAAPICAPSRGRPRLRHLLRSCTPLRRSAVEQAAIAGALNPLSSARRRRSRRAATSSLVRLDAHRKRPRAAGRARVENDSFVFTREVRGVRQALDPRRRPARLRRCAPARRTRRSLCEIYS